MPIDIDRLTEDELRDLHYRVTERLRVIHHLRAHGAMMRFSIGDRVMFVAEGRRVFGVLTRYNRRTVTVIAEGGHRWNVSPGYIEGVGTGSGSGPVAAESPIVVTPAGEAASNLAVRSGRADGS